MAAKVGVFLFVEEGACIMWAIYDPKTFQLLSTHRTWKACWIEKKSYRPGSRIRHAKLAYYEMLKVLSTADHKEYDPYQDAAQAPILDFK